VESPISLCQNGPTAPLTAIGDNVRWYAEAVGGIGSPIAPTPATNVPGTYTYYVSQTCGLESPRESITVVVNPRLIPNFQEIQPLCFGSEPPILNGSSPNGIAGTWSPSSINTTQNDSYNFTPNVNVCANEQTLNVEIIPSIEFGIFGRCSDGAYEMEAIPTKGTFDNNTLTFEWTDQNGNPLGVNQSVINLTEIVENTIAVELFPQDYRLSITDTNGCTATSTYTVEKVFCRIPSGISPNGDDKNDNFDLTGLSVTHLSIFNRYGVKVYSKDKYLNEWRGQTDSGHDLPDATYYYYVEFENKKPQTGWVYINR
jgi:gliding motility-associated-like protein